MTIIVNFLAGPCAGKSTASAGLFNKLKVAGFQTEYVQEFAKTITWERNYEALKHQPYITGVQMYRQNMLLNLVDVVITDAPVLLGLMYFCEPNQKVSEAFKTFVIESFKAQKNINFFIKRSTTYSNIGRRRTYEQAIEIDNEILNLMVKNDIPYSIINQNDDYLDNIANQIIEVLKKEIK